MRVILCLILTGALADIAKMEFERLKTFAAPPAEPGVFQRIELDVRNHLPISVYEEILRLCNEEEKTNYECELFNGQEASLRRDSDIERECEEKRRYLAAKRLWETKRAEWDQENPSWYWKKLLGLDSRPDTDYPEELQNSHNPDLAFTGIRALEMMGLFADPFYCERLAMYIPSYFKIKRKE